VEIMARTCAEVVLQYSPECPQVLGMGVVSPGTSSNTICALTCDPQKLAPGPANAELQVCCLVVCAID